MTRKNRLECWALRAKNGRLIGRTDMHWFESYKVLTFRTRKAALQYAAGGALPTQCEPVRILIQTFERD
jgi:hypothetical protein